MFTSRTKTCVGCTRPYFHFIDMSAQVPFWRVGHFWAFFWSLERQVALVFVFHLCPRSLFYWWFNGHLDWLKFNIPIFRAGSLGSPGSRLPAIHLSTHPSIHSLCNTDPSNSVVPFKLDHSIFHIFSRSKFSQNSKMGMGQRPIFITISLEE